MTGPIPQRVAQRAVTKVVVEGDCVLSTYSIGSHGYAQIGWQNPNSKTEMTTIQRAAWVFHHGEQVPDDMTVDHLCRNRRCVRAEHLRLLSNEDNGRMNGAAGHYPVEWPCPRNHDPRMRHTLANGRNVCEACVNVSREKYKRKVAGR